MSADKLKQIYIVFIIYHLVCSGQEILNVFYVPLYVPVSTVSLNFPI